MSRAVSLSRLVHLSVLVAPVLVGSVLLGPAMLRTLAGAAPETGLVLALAAVIYLVAHLVRALRLSVLATPLLGLSGRSGALLHLVTAPGALILPFKLGELLRLHQLWYLSGNFPGGLVVIVLERLFDGAMLLVLLLALYLAGQSGGLGLVFVMTALAVFAALIVVVLGPGAFRSLQSYIVRYHHKRRSLRHLGSIDLLRTLTCQAAELLTTKGAALLVLSLLVWCLEALAATLTVRAVTGEVDIWKGISTLAGRLLEAAQGADTWSAIGLLILLLVWPVALWLYLPRVPAEPLRGAVHPQPSWGGPSLEGKR